MSMLPGSNTTTPRRISPQDSLAKVHIAIFNDLKDIIDKYLDEMISDVRNARAAMGGWSPVVDEAEQILVPIKWLQTWVFIAAAQKRAEISDPSDQEKRRPLVTTEQALSELAFRAHLDPDKNVADDTCHHRCSPRRRPRNYGGRHLEQHPTGSPGRLTSQGKNSRRQHRFAPDSRRGGH